MTSPLTTPSPQERLAASRKALVRHMTRDAQPQDEDRESPAGESTPDGGTFSGPWGAVKHALGAWWRHHPASMAFELAQPTVKQYAQERPLHLLGIAAAAGAAVVLLRPWRLVSMGGLLLATLKSTEFSGALLSMLSGDPKDARQNQSQRRT